MTIRTFRDAVVLITGAATGIGQALGAELARRGAHVHLTDIQADKVEQNARAIARSGGNASAGPLDVRDAAAVKRAVDELRERRGRIDYVFANAGMGVFGEVHLLEERDWDMVLGVNLMGVVNTVRAAYPVMIDQGFGHLVNVASLAGLVGTPFLGPYCMAKHGVVGLSKAMRPEAARHGVRVSVLCPGPIRTPILTAGAFGRCVYPAFTEDRMMAWWKMHGPITELAPFIQDVVAGVSKNEAMIILPKRNRPLVRMLGALPGVAESIAGRVFGATLKRFPEVRDHRVSRGA